MEPPIDEAEASTPEPRSVTHPHQPSPSPPVTPREDAKEEHSSVEGPPELLKSAYCAGFVLFSPDGRSVVLVLEDKGYYGFPKGKQNLWERLDTTAQRELKEETGLSRRDIAWDPRLFVDEKHRNGVVVRLWVARYRGDPVDPLCALQCRKHDSVASVHWVGVGEALGFPKHHLSKQRKRCLRKALELLPYLGA